MIDLSQSVPPEELLKTKIQEIVSVYTDFPETIQMAQLARNAYNDVHGITNSIICGNPDLQLLNWIDTEYSLFRYKPQNGL